MSGRAGGVFTCAALVVALTFFVACGALRLHRQVEQPLGPQLTSGIGGTVFRLNKLGDLPNVFGRRDIWGGKVDRGFAEVKLAGIEGHTLILDVLEVSRQSSETTMDRYQPFQQAGVLNVEVKQSVAVAPGESPRPTRIRLDTRRQGNIVVSGIRVNFMEIQPYSVTYTLEDLQSR